MKKLLIPTLALATAPAFGVININFEETGDDITVTISGSLNIDGLTGNPATVSNPQSVQLNLGGPTYLTFGSTSQENYSSSLNGMTSFTPTYNQENAALNTTSADFS
ncbi:MAG: hypothetical protein ACQKBV_03265, partial [Puniceicoccales bacterium]